MQLSPEFIERRDRVRDAMAFKPTNGTPTVSTATGWQIYDSQHHFKDAYYNFKVLEQVITEYGTKYPFDCHFYTGTNYAFPVLDALGGGSYKLDPVTGAMSVEDHNYIFPEDYKEFAQNPQKYMRVSFQRKFPDLTTEKFEKAISEFMTFGRWARRAPVVFREVLKTPNTSQRNIMISLEYMNAGLRGIKDLSVDMRRHKAALKEYTQAHFEQCVLPGVKALGAAPKTEEHICDFGTAMLAHSFMNVKQFEEFYWPHLKQIIDIAVANNKTIFVFCENSMLRFKEFFQEVPKGTMILHLEDDDIREVRKELPNICLAGGVPIEHMGNGTKEQCMDDAKRLIDDMGEGYILGLTKIAAYKDDIKSENLSAVLDVCRNYKG